MWRGIVFGRSSLATRVSVAIAGALVAAAAAGMPATAAAQDERESGLQITPDEQQILVSKDVNDERWAIVRNPDGTVSGNVFPVDGGPPAFVWCEPDEEQSTDDELVFACFGADPCQASPCTPDEWTFIADVALPPSFFLPPQSVIPTATPGPTVTPTPIPIGTPTETPDASDTPSPTDTPDDMETPDGTETPTPTATPIPIATPD